MYLQQTEIKNKTALVTGAGKGIGKACAIALAEAGANLIILSRTKSDLDKVEKQITDVGDAVWAAQWSPHGNTITARTLADLDTVRLVKVDPHREITTKKLLIRESNCLA